ncbi:MULTISPECIES: SDR family NAD(P)-dependent oxidoreductase [Mycobacteriaceae]|jgi:NAD(P)-dependent dehydrogenase (short-subunit alcohol dehydrogenase family)|uniref:Short chain dehydrogenase n=1 Tax=Mycolicibacterium fluoranthenivorans TaxID=258505 RepID=A0A1G4X2U9_9MYCO|nr:MULTISPECIES: SDR family NAD(P)-dependent oxidoreductase [Mycobacteriaceae]MCV7253532.1 SDR family NAD(P)-dependent oxidoreductase [Mycobacterium hackensackense]SCX34597.1 short chain dehydrogenase [Mycolicibacterium fluoranthenivorans]
MSTENRDSAGRVVVVLDAGTTEGYRTARALLADGCRVVATDRHAAALVRILHDQSADRLLLLAADDSQRNLVLAKAKARFGRVDSVIRPAALPLVLSA